MDFNSFHSGYQLTSTMANSEDRDEMPHKAVFYQGLLCLLTYKQSLGTEIYERGSDKRVLQAF